MINRIDNSQIQDLLGKSSSTQPNSAEALPNNDTDASLQVNYASFINQAMQIPQTDTDALRQARQLLLSGQLESPKNIRSAAENILDFGI